MLAYKLTILSKGSSVNLERNTIFSFCYEISSLKMAYLSNVTGKFKVKVFIIS